MKRILWALTILGAGAGGFLPARQSTTQLQHEANAARQAWLVQTQLVAVAHSDQAGLLEHIRELKQALIQPQAVGENALWAALQTNRAGHFTPELRGRLLEEFGFNWQSSPDFIVVSKDTVREIQMQAIGDDKLTDVAVTVLALTPGERGQVEAAMQRVQADSKAWALAHVERNEPKDDVVAQYTLPNDPTMNTSNNFAAGVFEALGRERAELIMPSVENRINGEPTTMILKRYLVGNEQRLKFQVFWSFGTPMQAGDAYPLDLSKRPFPRAFLPVFPNGWTDVAKREGFELPEESPEK